MLVLFSLTGSHVVETGAGPDTMICSLSPRQDPGIEALHILFERCSKKVSVSHCTIHLLVEVGRFVWA
ncbi:MAG TPA: hypothetical protein VFQ36_02320, partial [Ktedonobacteraceae bacterium]|nr:hypothetical protein [Ktedonobacteraceae bacterium]